jgi:hypothetical protein
MAPAPLSALVVEESLVVGILHTHILEKRVSPAVGGGLTAGIIVIVLLLMIPIYKYGSEPSVTQYVKIQYQNRNHETGC